MYPSRPAIFNVYTRESKLKSKLPCTTAPHRGIAGKRTQYSYLFVTDRERRPYPEQRPVGRFFRSSVGHAEQPLAIERFDAAHTLEDEDDRNPDCNRELGCGCNSASGLRR
jgi:hypothetical protein